jgi:DNA repair photolyase
MVSITSLKEELRLKMEPRTASAKKRMNVLNQLSKAGVPCGVMTAPIIPGLNSMEIPSIIKQAADNGAVNAGYTIVRLNGSIGEIFTDWIHKNFSDRAEKVLHQIQECHGGQLNDSRYGTRIKGEGKIADSIKQIFVNSVKRYMKNRYSEELNTADFRRPGEAKQLELF